jgi:hypothetical protein
MLESPTDVSCLEVDAGSRLAITVSYDNTREIIWIDYKDHSLEEIAGIRDKLRELAILIDQNRNQINKDTGEIGSQLKENMKQFIQNCKQLYEIAFGKNKKIYDDFVRMGSEGKRIEYVGDLFPIHLVIPSDFKDYDFFPSLLFQSNCIFIKRVSGGLESFNYCTEISKLKLLAIYNKKLGQVSVQEIPHIKTLLGENFSDVLEGNYKDSNEIINCINQTEFGLLHIASPFVLDNKSVRSSAFKFGNGVSLSLFTIDEEINSSLEGKIVFLNVCNSANENIHFSDSCNQVFFRKGAAGIISVDLLVRDGFAMEFSKRFYNNLITKEPISLEYAVYKTKRDMLKEGNILALFYSYYGTFISFNNKN